MINLELIPEKMLKMLRHMNWRMMLSITVLSAIGFAMMYSAAGGEMEPWAWAQINRYILFFLLMLGISFIPLELVLRLSYVPYVICVLLLVGVEVAGQTIMGAQRWINMGGFSLQPSELMKVSLVIALARYFHGLHFKDIPSKMYLVPPLLMILVPFVLILKQPDLGTALILLALGGAMFFLAGVRVWKFVVVAGLGFAAVPILWNHMKDYQKQRVLTFLDPGSDPLGAGYNILQSQIAIGSGGGIGKGYLSGSQNQLSFLPEKHTDFIFTMFAEEFGFLGGFLVLGLFSLLMFQGYKVALECRSHFGRLLATGVMTLLFLHIFINIAMVMGLIPVVGAPLPLFSYGGTIMLTMMVGFGLVLGAHNYGDVVLSRSMAGEE